MNDNYKFTAGLILGAFAGTALALYLSSEKGKELLNDIHSDAASLRSTLDAGIDKVDESLHDVLSRAKIFVAELEQKLEQTQTS